VILAVVTGLVPVEEIEGAGVIGKKAEGDAGEDFGLASRGGILVVLAVHLNLEGGLFKMPGAHTAPAGDDHGVDEVRFDGIGGLESGDELLVEGVERFLAFPVKEHRLAKQAVLDGVAGGGDFALLSDWSTGFAAVRPGGFDLKF